MQAGDFGWGVGSRRGVDSVGSFHRVAFRVVGPPFRLPGPRAPMDGEGQAGFAWDWGGGVSVDQVSFAIWVGDVSGDFVVAWEWDRGGPWIIISRGIGVGKMFGDRVVAWIWGRRGSVDRVSRGIWGGVGKSVWVPGCRGGMRSWGVRRSGLAWDGGRRGDWGPVVAWD